MKKHEPLTENEKMLIKEGLKKEAPSFVRQLLIAIGICVFFYVFLTYLSPITTEGVSGQSMEPTFHDGDVIVVDKRKSTINKLQPGDIIITKHLQHLNNHSPIKRLILSPNSQYDNAYISSAQEEADGIAHLYLYNGDTYTQNDKVNEYYIKEPMKNTESFSFQKEEDHYVILGDNRNHSVDSRRIGAISKDEIEGKVLFRLFPFTKF